MTAPVIIPSATLDVTFSGDGKQSTGFGSTNDTARAVATMADGRFVVVGNAGDDFAVARYLANGNLDTSFSGDGKVTTDVPGVGVAQAVAVQPDGKVVVVGSGNGGLDMVVARYNSDGSLDTSFNTTGLITTSLDAGTRREGNATVLIQPDGAIVVAGYSHVGDRAAIIQRYTSTGALDTSFSTDGRDQLNFRGLIDRSEILAMTRQADGKLLVAGRVDLLNNAGTAYDFAVARYNANGTLDTTFNASGPKPGVLIIDNGSTTERINDMQVQTDGKIVLVGNRGSDGFIARLLADGSMDNSFDGNGIATFDNGGSTDEFNSLNIQADGKYLVGGRSGSDALVARFLATDGSLDAGFNSTGFLTTQLVDQNSNILDTALTPGGKFLAVGEGSYDFGSSSWDFAMMQLGVALPEQKIMASLGPNRPAEYSDPAAINYQVPSNIFHDPDGTPLTYTATLANGSALPSWLSFDSATRTFTGTPSYRDFGAYSIQVSASDGSASVSSEFQLQVTTDFINALWYAPTDSADRRHKDSALGTPVSITYSFMKSGSAASVQKETDTWGTMTEAQQTAVRTVLARYAEVSGISFTEVIETGTTVGTLRYGTYRSDTDGNSGYARGNNIWMNRKYLESYTSIDEGTRPFNTVLHETGHLLGFNHPGSDPGDNAHPWNDTDYGLTDMRTSTVMSYVYRTDKDTTDVAGGTVNPSTPMMWDVAALQYLYGVNQSFNAGDNVYTYAPSAPFFKNIWDGGGNDTIDISNYVFASKVSLIDGSFSSLRTMASQPGDATLYWGNNNLSISYNVVIENAIGGAGSDTLIGNGAGNKLQGNAGNDTLTGGTGNDSFAYDVSQSSGTDTITDLQVGDKLTFTRSGGSVFNLQTNLLAGGNGSGLTSGQVMVGATAGGITTLYIGTDATAGADITIQLQGNYAAGDFTVTNDGTGATLTYAGAGGGVVPPAPGTVIGGTAGADTQTGNTGNDTLSASAGNDSLNGGAGTDTVDFSQETAPVSVILYGNQSHGLSIGVDTLTAIENIVGSQFNDLVYGDLGNNLIQGGLGQDTLDGAEGHDTLQGQDGGDLLNGLAGNDSLEGGEGNDSLYGWADLDTLVGGLGDDRLFGGAQADALDGGDGADNLEGDDGNDTIAGGAGNDTLRGWNDNDSLDGGDGNDLVVGWSGNDSLVGGLGDDQLFGDDGADTLVGGTGGDVLQGGMGNDLYLFDAAFGFDGARDYDYTAGNSDTFQFNGVNLAELSFAKVGDALKVERTASAGADVIYVNDWYMAGSNGAYKIETWVMGDGTYTAAQIEALVV